MAHNIQTFVSTQQEWHHHLTKHNIVDKPMVIEEALTLGGIDWEVGKRPVYIAGADGRAIEVKDTFANVRLDNDYPFGIVGKGYKSFQNRQMLQVMAKLAEDTGVFRFQTAGALGDGSIVFALGSFVERYDVLTGDEHRYYLYAQLTHDGTGAVKFFITDVRVVCNNTRQVALRKVDQNKVVRISHLGDMDVKLDEARELLGLAHLQIAEETEAMKQLANIVVTSTAADKFLESLFPFPDLDTALDKLAEEKMREAMERIQKTRDKVGELAVSGRGVDAFPEVIGTAYGWLNAVTEYTTHEQSRKDKSLGGQLHALANGEGARLNNKALTLLRSDLLLAA